MLLMCDVSVNFGGLKLPRTLSSLITGATPDVFFRSRRLCSTLLAAHAMRHTPPPPPPPLPAPSPLHPLLHPVLPHPWRQKLAHACTSCSNQSPISPMSLPPRHRGRARFWRPFRGRDGLASEPISQANMLTSKTSSRVMVGTGIRIRSAIDTRIFHILTRTQLPSD